jgi:hypothetical protein
MALLTEGGGMSTRDSINMALLTEGGGMSTRGSINTALLTEGGPGVKAAAKGIVKPGKLMRQF